MNRFVSKIAKYPLKSYLSTFTVVSFRWNFFCRVALSLLYVLLNDISWCSSFLCKCVPHNHGFSALLQKAPDIYEELLQVSQLQKQLNFSKYMQSLTTNHNLILKSLKSHNYSSVQQYLHNFQLEAGDMVCSHDFGKFFVFLICYVKLLVDACLQFNI